MPIITQEMIDNRSEICYCCEGCNRVTENFRCSVYLDPEVKWAHGGCALASHVFRAETTKHGKVRVGQQKQRKR
jgi:hypothetical protein